MPDISMCPGGYCMLKETCYRYKATPCQYRQSYFVDPPYDKSTFIKSLPVLENQTPKEIMVSSPEMWDYCSAYWPYVGRE